MSVPRNLRSPTPRRVAFWWRDFLWAWDFAGHMYANEIEAAQDEQDEAVRVAQGRAESETQE